MDSKGIAHLGKISIKQLSLHRVCAKMRASDRRSLPNTGKGCFVSTPHATCR